MAIWSALLLGERLPLAGYVGVALLIVGVYIACLPSSRDMWRPLRRCGIARLSLPFWPPSAWQSTPPWTSAVATVDPIVYNFWVYAGIAVVYAPMVWLWHGARELGEWRGNWRRILVGSFSTVGSYMLALAALSQRRELRGSGPGLQRGDRRALRLAALGEALG